MSKGESEFAETTEFASIPHNEKLKPVVSDENVGQDRFFMATLIIKSNVKLIGDINERLSDTRLALLRATVFGPWLQLKDKCPDPILCLMFLQCQIFPPNLRENEMMFEVNGWNLRFGRKDFCLITGLTFGEMPVVRPHANGFVRRVFRRSSLTVGELKSVYQTIGANDQFSDDEAVRICLLMMAETFFLGHQSAVKVPDVVLNLIEELGSWNNFPWGSYIWDYTFRQMDGAIRKHTVRKRALTLTGFLFALKIWVLETFPAARSIFILQNRMPRGVRWDRDIILSSKHVFAIMDVDDDYPPHPPQATYEEKLQPWYVASHAYFGKDDDDDDGEHDDDDEGPRHMDEGPSHMYEGSHPSYNMPLQMPHEGGQFPPCFPHEYFTPYWMRLSKCETGVTYLRGQDKKDTADIILLKERDKFHHNRYENLDGRLKKLERFRQDFENLTVSELAFHTPTTITGHIPPEEPMERGLCIRKTAPVQGIPYTQQGSTTLPKRPKGKEKEKEKMKKERDTYLRKRRPAKESVVVALYWQDELQEGQQLRCLPYDTVGPNWWKILLGLDGQGWYFSTHIEAWLRYILVSRPNHASWTIMVPDFWTYMSSGTVDGPSHGYGVASGNLANENFPAWFTITQVLMPICIDEKHWVLGIMNIDSMRMTIHDTLGVEHLQQQLYRGFAIFQHSLKLLFERLDDPLRAARAEHLGITIAPDTPRQSGHLGDCGPWICRFLSQFTGAVNLPPVIDPEQTMLDFRHQMADILWEEWIG